MSAVLIAIIILLACSTGYLLVRELKRRRTEAKITPAATRILFPFVGDSLSTPAFDAALRLARAPRGRDSGAGLSCDRATQRPARHPAQEAGRGRPAHARGDRAAGRHPGGAGRLQDRAGT